MAFLRAEEETTSRAGRTIEVRRQKYKNHTTGGGAWGGQNKPTFLTGHIVMKINKSHGYICELKVDTAYRDERCCD
jgi:hypothetical protein